MLDPPLTERTASDRDYSDDRKLEVQPSGGGILASAGASTRRTHDSSETMDDAEVRHRFRLAVTRTVISRGKSDWP